MESKDDFEFHGLDDVEDFLNRETVAAVALHCVEDYHPACTCTWCYRMSSNGFHVRNAGQCRCVEEHCPCARNND